MTGREGKAITFAIVVDDKLIIGPGEESGNLDT